MKFHDSHPTAVSAMKRIATRIALVLVAALGAWTPAAAADEGEVPEFRTVTSANGTEMAAGQVIVKFADGTSSAEKDRAAEAVDASGTERVGGLEGSRLIELGSGMSIGEAVRELNARSEVEYAHPNYVFGYDTVPNDPMFSQLWGMRDTVSPDMDINAEQAWDYTTGSANVDIAVVDSGLAAIATNQGSFPTTPHPDLDDNVDYLKSRNFYGGAGADPAAWWDSNNHGTHVAGTIGAEGNNGIGVTGVNWDTNLIAVKVGGVAFQPISASDMAAGLDYAGTIGADVVNMSMSRSSLNENNQDASVIGDAIESHPGTLYVLSAGNHGRDIDVTPTYPCGERLANTICVAATVNDGTLWDVPNAGSNYGDQTVHLGAPGIDIKSTIPGLPPDYLSIGGTSMAAPHVTGVAGLVKSMEPAATTQEIKSAILENVTPTASLVGKTVTEGRLNAADAVQSMTRFSECKVPGGSTYRTFWETLPNSTIDITDIRGKAPSEAFFRDYVDTWGDVSKLEWYSLQTIANTITPSGAWGSPDYPAASNSWDYAVSWGAEDQRTDILATDPYPQGNPRISFRSNGTGWVRDADSCNTYLSKWPAGSGKKTVIAGDSMVSQMTKKFVNQSGWKPFVEPQSKSSFANMKGEIRGLASGLVDSTTDEQTKPEVMVMALGTKDADAIAALATQPERDAAVTTMRSNIDQALSATSGVQCRIVVTTHETGYLPNGTYSTPLKDARLAVNAKLRAVANASASVDIVDWGYLSAGHGAHEAAGTRWYEPSDRENPNPAGLTALSNAIINKAQGSCS